MESPCYSYKKLNEFFFQLCMHNSEKSYEFFPLLDDGIAGRHVAGVEDADLAALKLNKGMRMDVLTALKNIQNVS